MRRELNWTSLNGEKLDVGRRWVGLDGEGITLGTPHSYSASCVITGEKHRYISMSYRAADGWGDEIENREGLSTKDCLHFILSTPKSVKIAAYGFGYDLTKILEDLPPELIYFLTHPERRAYHTGHSRVQYRPVFWEGFSLDLFNTKFRVGYADEDKIGRRGYTGRNHRIVYDLVKFYQAKFVTACKNWDVGTPQERDTMRIMKNDRRNLIKYTQQEVLDYSNKECVWLAELAQKLDDACEETGIKLGASYFGAGSIAKALMRSWGLKGQMVELPPEIADLARIAFFGGRFEIALRGIIERLVHDWDISAAYPYQIFMLPCLQCGRWSKTTDIDRVQQASAALVNYKLDRWKGALPPWGPFPFRDSDGTIPFPIESGGGWLHKSEFLAGLKLFPNVRFKGAWVYETPCNHKPFEKISDVYLERIRIGKEGAGIVLKLGTNAIAGSIMQTVGTRPYHNSVWAGMITAGTRAQLLEMLGQHEKWSDVIMMATDGLWGFADVKAPKPVETGTDVDVIEEKTGKKIHKPLGGWEHDEFKEGVFMARPGIYFPLGLEDMGDEDNEKADGKFKDLKARGIGVRTLYLHRERIKDHYQKTSGRESYLIRDENPIDTITRRDTPNGVERFVGLKSGVIRNALRDAGEITGERIRKRDVYGLWTLQERKIDFKSLPKRNEGDGTRLEVRRLPRTQESLEYDRMRDTEAKIDDALAGAMDIGFFDDEQNDWAE